MHIIRHGYTYIGFDGHEFRKNKQSAVMIRLLSVISTPNALIRLFLFTIWYEGLEQVVGTNVHNRKKNQILTDILFEIQKQFENFEISKQILMPLQPLICFFLQVAPKNITVSLIVWRKRWNPMDSSDCIAVFQYCSMAAFQNLRFGKQFFH